MLHDVVEAVAGAEDVADDIFRVKPDRHVDAVADVAEHHREMLHRVPGQRVGIGLGLAARRVDVGAFDALDQRLLALAVGDEVGDRHALQPIRLGKRGHLRAAHDGAVVVDQFADDADLRQAGELAEVDGGFGMAGAHQHAALASDQREDVAGPREIGSADIAVGEVAHRQRAVVGGDAGGGAVLEIDADSKGRRVGGIVVGDHRRKVQPLGVGARHRRADDAGSMTHDEGHLLRRAMDGRDDQVAFVLAPVIVHHDDDLAALEGADSFDDFLLIVGHERSLCSRGVGNRE